MSDLIDRQAAIDAIEREAYRHTYIEQIIDIINNLPPAQPEHHTENLLAYAHDMGVTIAQAEKDLERKTGQWRPVQIGKWHGFECTACKVNREVPCSNSGIPQWKYCPECGAKMEVEHV